MAGRSPFRASFNTVLVVTRNIPWCGADRPASPAVRWQRVMPEETYIVIGYTCPCGERVTVQRWKSGDTARLPKHIIVVCSRGHVASFDSVQMALLDMWTEESAS